MRWKRPSSRLPRRRGRWRCGTHSGMSPTGTEGRQEAGRLTCPRVRSAMTFTVEPLGPWDVPALRAMLAKDATHHLYLLGVLEEFGVVSRPQRIPFAFYGRFTAQRELCAVVFVGGDGGLLVPSSSDADS